MSNQDKLQEVKLGISATKEDLQKATGTTDAEILAAIEAERAKQKFMPTLPVKKTPEQIQTASVDVNIEERIKQMELEILRLRAGQVNGVKVTTPTKKVLDFSKLSETDVYDMSIPIEAIPQGYLDPTQIKLKDPMYVARLVAINVRAMGIRKAQGFSYVTKEDIDWGSVPVGLDLEPDENGQYRYIDVVLMKIPKEKYFASLRANHLRAMAVVDRKRAVQAGKAAVEQELSTGTDDKGQSYTRDYKSAQELGAGGKPKMEVYI